MIYVEYSTNIMKSQICYGPWQCVIMYNYDFGSQYLTKSTNSRHRIGSINDLTCEVLQNDFEMNEVGIFSIENPQLTHVCLIGSAQYLNMSIWTARNNSPVLLRGIARVPTIIITTTIYDSEYAVTRSAILPSIIDHTVTAEAIDYMGRDL